MPYKNCEQKKAYDRQRYQKMKQGERPNPLTPDQWKSLQRAAWRQGRGCWELVRRLAELWGVEPFH